MNGPLHSVFSVLISSLSLAEDGLNMRACHQCCANTSSTCVLVFSANPHRRNHRLSLAIMVMVTVEMLKSLASRHLICNLAPVSVRLWLFHVIM
jgi:hypothetical protein